MNNLMKIFIVVLFICLMSFESVTQAHVLDGAKEWNGHYYKMIAMQMRWDNADKFCKSIGGHLATAETSAENEMIKEIVNRYTESKDAKFWIGGTLTKEGIWKWVTGKTIVDYFDWANGAPEGYSVQNEQKRLLMSRSDNSKWRIGVYDWSYQFVCEWEKAEDAHESTL